MASKKTSIEVSPEVKQIVTYLKRPQVKNEKCFYDNLSGFIGNLLTERTKDTKTLHVEFQSESKQTLKKQSRTEEAIVKKQLNLFALSDEESAEITEREEEFEIPLSNFSRMGHFFEQAGIGFGQEENFRILLALRALALECTFVHVRFWGKMFGIQSNYYIAETEYRDGEGQESMEENDGDLSFDDGNVESDTEEPKEDDGLPKPDWKEPEEAHPEAHHSGTNKHVYFVCNKLGDPWTKLPHVSPLDIVSSRKITKFLNGDLSTPINCYPNFRGTEANYLRALIARISATTQISPTGYFMFDDEGEDDDEDEIRDTYMVNMNFEGIPVRQLKYYFQINWVHNLKYILPQGRCTWWNPSNKFHEDFEEDEEEPDDEQMIPQESGPQLLTAVGNDADVCGGIPAWSASYASKVTPNHSICVMKSNLWPGAYAFSNGKIFENIYVGWGKKYSSNCFNQMFPPSSIEEYNGKDIDLCEVDDPTVEQEEEFKMMEEEAHKSADEIDNIEEDD